MSESDRRTYRLSVETAALALQQAIAQLRCAAQHAETEENRQTMLAPLAGLAAVQESIRAMLPKRLEA